MTISSENRLNVDLYHGTSTLFLDSITQNGLGAINPVKEWNILELCQEVYELSEEHLKDTKLYEISIHSLKFMSEQMNKGSMNFQHGDTYLSPVKETGIRYAIDKEYGSELLTYTINFLKELLNKDIPYVKTELFQRFPKIFGLIEAKPSPILIQVKNADIFSLLSEDGKDPFYNLKFMQESMNKGGKMYDLLCQQSNFRLTAPIPIENLKFWFINVQEYHHILPKYNLYEINIRVS